MNLEYLKTFYTTVKENSISKTAKLLHMSQPGVSVQLQALEKELGFKLLVRSNKGVVLTDAGKIVFDYAISLLSIQREIARDLDSLKTHVHEMVVSSCTSVGSYALPCSIYLFKKKYPNIKVLLDICNSETVIKNLLDNSSHIGIIEGNPHNCQIEAIKVTTSNFILVCAKKICRYERIPYSRLREIPLIIREKGSGNRRCLEDSLHQNDLNLEEMNVVLELTSTEAIKSAVSAGKGYALLPELAIKYELCSGFMKKVEIEDTIFESHFYLAHVKDKAPKGTQKKFYDFIKSGSRGFC